MNARILVLTAVSLPFLALTTVAVVQHGLIGIFAVALRDTASAQVFADLCVSLFLVTGWLRNDARRRGLAWVPWFVATPFLGSIAPLGYLFWRELQGVRD
ncbi:MAG: DUF2834 domain-containing protein [Alphaproteobacteria bacterium]|nr:DUF2834 domain-containing protein [Alphaproteobacteria bacterium]